MATTSKQSKSPTGTTDTVIPSASPQPTNTNYVASASKESPLSAVMLMCVGLSREVTDEQRLLLAQFIQGSTRVSPSHIAGAARFFTKRVHVEYTTLVLKCAGQIAFEGGTSLPRVRSEIEKATGICVASRREAEKGYDDTYKSYKLEEVTAAISYLWDSYGKGGVIHDGLVDRANDRAKTDREARA